MKPILIHVHVYYPEIWPEIRDLLTKANLPEYDLFITMVEEHGRIREEAHEICPKAQVQLVENRGYDIWPFLYVLKQVNLHHYSYCIKLHTKRDIPISLDENLREVIPYSLIGNKWRNYLLDIIRPANLSKNLNRFHTCPKLGMVANFKIIMPRETVYLDAYKECVKIIEQQGASAPSEISYVAGSMFICRAHLMEPLQQLPYTALDFVPPTPERPISLAHVLERYLGWCVIHRGFTIRDTFTPYSSLRMKIGYVLDRMKRAVYRNKITKNGRHIIKICRIPVYFGKVNTKDSSDSK